MKLSDLLQVTIEKGASDLHIIAGYAPTIRVRGDLHQLSSFPIISPQDSQDMLFSIVNNEQKENLISNREIDLGYEYGENRFRINIYYARNSLAAGFRLIPSKIKTIEELGLPPFLHKCVDYKQGLVLLTGPTGEGKSTTLASIIDEINHKHARHIITVEDPIEYMYPFAKSIISQRQLHEDTHSWNIALKSALREDPDVLLVGEMRDYETIQLVLTAAETGHLVFSTLHTNSTPEAIDRIIDIFPSNQQNQVKNQLSSVLKIVLSQRLLPPISGSDRIPAIELLINNSAIASVIREGKTFLINNTLETSEDEGLILFEKNLLSLYRAGKISKETAFSYAIRPKELEKFIR